MDWCLCLCNIDRLDLFRYKWILTTIQNDEFTSSFALISRQTAFSCNDGNFTVQLHLTLVLSSIVAMRTCLQSMSRVFWLGDNNMDDMWSYYNSCFLLTWLQQQLTTRHSDKQMTNRYQKRYLTCDIHCIYPQLSILIKQNPSTFRVLHIYQDNSRSDQHWGRPDSKILSVNIWPVRFFFVVLSLLPLAGTGCSTAGSGLRPC